MNFSSAVAKNNTPNKNTTQDQSSTVSASETIDVLCQSPSGTIRPKTIRNPLRSASPNKLDDIELTSQNNPEIRAEAKRIFNSYDEDLEAYQEELRKSNKKLKIKDSK